MATNAIGTQPKEIEKKKRVRSPNYPTVGLKEAIERTKRFVDADGRAGATAAFAAVHIGFATAHGQAYSVLSALKKFGLVEDKDGRVVPTQRAMEIVNLPEADERRKKAIRDAALSPALYAEIIKDYKATGLPSDETLKGELVAYKGFNSKGVDEFLKGFRATLDFAGLTDFSVLEAEDRSGTPPPSKLKVGDFVQWVSQGADRFDPLKRIEGLSEDGKFAFVEGEKTGFPVNELEIGEVPSAPLPPSSARWMRKSLPPANTGGSVMRNDVYSLDDGREVVISWPTPLPAGEAENIKDWLKIVEKKIAKSISTTPPIPSNAE